MLRELLDLIIMQFKTIKAYLATFIFFPIIYPIAIILVFGSISAKEFAPYIVAGTTTFNISIGVITLVSQILATERQTGRFSLMVAAGIPKEVYAISIALSNGLADILSIIVTLLVGIYFLHLQVASIPYLIVTIIASIFMASMFGMALGLGIKNPYAVYQYSIIISMALSFFAPVYFPITFIPMPFRYLAYLEPTTYVSQALYNAFEGNPASLLWSLGIVVIGVIFVVISRYVMKGV